MTLKIVSSFTKRFNEALRICHKKQICISEMTGMTKSCISLYKSGQREPTSFSLTILSEAFGCNELWLLGYNVPFGRDLDITEVN